MIHFLTSRLGIVSVSVLVLVAVLGVAGCREDRLHTRVDRLEATNLRLSLDLDVCMVDKTKAEGGRDLLELYFAELKDKARQDSAAHAVVLRLAKRTASGLRVQIDSLRARAARDTTTFNYKDLWF